jgi:hypothetical protein
MFNAKVTLVASMMSFALVGLAYAAPGKAVVQGASLAVSPAPAEREVIPMPESFQDASEVILVAPRAVVRATVKPVVKVYVCGGWEDSSVGGSYKRCEWK